MPNRRRKPVRLPDVAAPARDNGQRPSRRLPNLNRSDAPLSVYLTHTGNGTERAAVATLAIYRNLLATIAGHSAMPRRCFIVPPRAFLPSFSTDNYVIRNGADRENTRGASNGLRVHGGGMDLAKRFSLDAHVDRLVGRLYFCLYLNLNPLPPSSPICHSRSKSRCRACTKYKRNKTCLLRSLCFFFYFIFHIETGGNEWK